MLQNHCSSSKSAVVGSFYSDFGRLKCLKSRQLKKKLENTLELNFRANLDERQAERSPHERVDDWVDARVQVGQSLEGIDDHRGVLAMAAFVVYDNDNDELVRQPGHRERRRNDCAHPGHFARCLLLGG